MTVVADTSPITALLHLKLLSILGDLYGKIIVPATVAKELHSLVKFGYDVNQVFENPIFEFREASDVNLLHSLLVTLDKGEAESIVLALEMKADLLIIDEKLGKQKAIEYNIFCKGVVGVLLDAKKLGLIKEIKPLLNSLLKDLNFRLSKIVYEEVLKRAGEN